MTYVLSQVSALKYWDYLKVFKPNKVETGHLRW